MNKELEKKIAPLIESFVKLDNYQDVLLFLDDLCTVQELKQLEQRLEAAKMLMNGATYEEVTACTSISSATLSRVSKCIHQGGGGYQKVIKKQ